MIYSLTGTIQTIGENYIVLDVNNIGYMVYCTLPMISKQTTSANVSLIIYHHFREDSQQLFGFKNEPEREFLND